MNALTLVSLLLQAVPLHARLYEKNILVWDVSPDAVITGNEIKYHDPDSRPGLRCTRTEVCAAPGTRPTLSTNKKYFACCLDGQHLLGSPETAFDCCADGHDLAGSPETGYHCCPTGYDFDGRLCKPKPVTTCKNGKVMVNGQCVCPEGTTDAADGSCQPRFQPVTTCKNGKVMVNGQCVCPEGTTDAADGSCQPRFQPRSLCDSGLESGEYKYPYCHPTFRRIV
jgi:hypothetical protein